MGNSGTGICVSLLIIIVVLKLVGIISWSWWLVTALIWMPITLFIVVAIGYVILDKYW